MTVHLDPIAEVLHLKDLLGQANALARIRAERIAEKDEALRVALEALQLTMVPLREYKAEEARKARNEAIAKIKEAL